MLKKGIFRILLLAGVLAADVGVGRDHETEGGQGHVTGDGLVLVTVAGAADVDHAIDATVVSAALVQKSTKPNCLPSHARTQSNCSTATT